MVKLNKDPFIYSNRVHLHHQKPVNVTEPILWIHWLKVKHNGDKCLSTFYPYLGITRWLVTTGKGGKLVGWVLVLFGDLQDSFCSGVLLRSGLGDDSLLFLSSVCGWQVVQVCICVSFVSCRDFGLFCILCSFLHAQPSVQWLSLVHQWWTWIGRLSASC